MARRFRGFLPVIVDVETGGFNCATDALLEIAAVFVVIDGDGRLQRHDTHCYQVQAFAGSVISPQALAVNGIDPDHPLRPALPERDALQRIFRVVRERIRAESCRRAILVGHNAAFDLGFLNAAVQRCGIKRNPFHPFSSFDTATLAGAALGQTVLAKAVQVAGIDWESDAAHSASYDAERTAELFCTICNDCRSSYEAAHRRAISLGWQDQVTASADSDEPTDRPAND
ncbi:MAG: ribonuclease T [Steroidobacteraceae bacterium]